MRTVIGRKWVEVLRALLPKRKPDQQAAALAAHARGSAWLMYLFLLVAQAGFLAYLAGTANFTGDGGYYTSMAGKIWTEGLLHDDPYIGYRSYFVPLWIALVAHLPGAKWFVADPAFYFGTNQSALFFLVTVALTLAAHRKGMLRLSLPYFVATMFNPFLLAYLAMPLQESALVFFVAPMLLLVCTPGFVSASARIALVVLIAFLAYIIRSSLVWVAVPVIAYLVDAGLASRPRWTRHWKPAVLACVAGVLLLAPHWYVVTNGRERIATGAAAHHNLLQVQVAWGIRAFKYGTLLDEQESRGVWFHSPFRYADPPHDIGFYARHPLRGGALVAGHVYSGLHYDVLLPYFRRADIRLVSGWLVLSSLTIFYGVFGLVEGLRRRWPTPAGTSVLLTGLALLSCGYTAFVATEARFGLLGFSALSIAACAAFAHEASRARAKALLPLAAVYVLLAVLVNAWLLASAGLIAT